MGTIATVTPTSGKRAPQRVGTQLVWEGTIALTSSYATGGETLNAKTLGMEKIEGGMIAPFGANLLRVIPQTDPATAKILATVSNSGAEVANATNLSSVVAYARIVGR